MKTLIAVLVLISASGCAHSIFDPPGTKECWVPDQPKESYAEINRDIAECQNAYYTGKAQIACIQAKGYTFQECYRRNQKPVSGQAVLKSELAAKE